MGKPSNGCRTAGRTHKNGVNRVAGIRPAPSETESNGPAQAEPAPAPAPAAPAPAPAPAPGPAPAPAPASKADGRTAAGEFCAGNKFGRGNPFARKLGAMRSAFLNAASETNVASLAHKLLEQALAGDVEAARLYLRGCEFIRRFSA